MGLAALWCLEERVSRTVWARCGDGERVTGLATDFLRAWCFEAGVVTAGFEA